MRCVECSCGKKNYYTIHQPLQKLLQPVPGLHPPADKTQESVIARVLVPGSFSQKEELSF